VRQKNSETLVEDKTYFFSASGDSGGALGAAALGYFQLNKKIKLPTRFDINFSKIGRVFSEDFCEDVYARVLFEKNKKQAKAQLLGINSSLSPHSKPANLESLRKDLVKESNKNYDEEIEKVKLKLLV
jgi:predicted NodU family carbamoyl transferase